MAEKCFIFTLIKRHTIYTRDDNLSKQSQSRATTQYIKRHMRQYVIRFQKEQEAEMIAWLDKSDNVTQTIKRLIVEEMERERK